jgi:hypothetical protein
MVIELRKPTPGLTCYNIKGEKTDLSSQKDLANHYLVRHRRSLLVFDPFQGGTIKPPRLL